MCFVGTEHNAGYRYCLGIPERKPNEKASAIVDTVSGTVNKKARLKQAIRTSSAAQSKQNSVLRKDENIGCSVTAATVMWEVPRHIAGGKVSDKLKSVAVIVRQTVDSPKGFYVRKSFVLMFTSTTISEFRTKISLFDFRRLKSGKQTIKSHGRL